MPVWEGDVGKHQLGIRVAFPYDAATRKQLKQDTAERRLVELWTGCYFDFIEWFEYHNRDKYWLTCIAVALKYRGRFLCEDAAIATHRLPQPRIPAKIVVGSTRCKKNSTPGETWLGALVHCRYRQVPEEHIVMASGVAVTSVAWTAAAIISRLRTDDDFAFYYGLMVVEAAMSRGITKDAIQECAMKKDGKRRGPLVTKVLDNSTYGSESPAESYMRGLLISAGFPRFIQQANIFNDKGEWAGRVDFLFPEYGLIIEVDGEIKYRGEDVDTQYVLRKERRRENGLANLGYRVIRIRWAEMESREALEIIAAALRAHPKGALTPRGFAEQAPGIWVDNRTRIKWLTERRKKE